MLLPFVWMLSTSVKPADQLFTVPPTWLPRPIQWDNYVKAMGAGNFGRYAMNSLFLGITNLATNVLLSALAGYAFARLRFPGRNALFVLVLATLMVPYQVTIIPLFVIVRHIPLFGGNDFLGQGGIGWINSYWGLIVPGAVGAFGIFMLRQFFQTLPVELEDAARIDGAGEFRIYWKIVMPLCRPALAALGIFTFSYVWNDFFWPLIIVTSSSLYTMPLGLALFVVQNRTAWDYLMAGSVIVTIPVIVMFLAFQRHFIRGISITGMK
jgi:multiple sugar transport system permease protein